MHYPAISVKFAQRVRIINWCMHKHVQCVMCWVWCVVMSCDATLSLSLFHSLRVWSLIYTSVSSLISLLRHFLFYQYGLLSVPCTVCLSLHRLCHLFRVMSGWLSSVWKCIRCQSISVCTSVGLSFRRSVACLLLSLSFLCVHVPLFIRMSSCSCHIPT